MACDPQLFSGVDAATLASIKDSLKREYGFSIDADMGEQTHRGFTFEWAYEASEQSLRIQCVGKPLLVPCGVINNRINELAAKSGAAPS
jgi:hypothetical protein